MSYPEKCIKGIPNDDFILEDETIGSHLFHFDEKNQRNDEWIEQSINWEDDENAIEFTMKQLKENGETQFKSGVVIIPRSEIDRLNTRPTIKGKLSYERASIPDNKYHGNLLLKKGVLNQQ